MQHYMDKMTEQRKQSRSKFVQLPRTIKSPKSEKKSHPACRSGCYIYAASLFHNTSYWCVLSMAINKMRYEIMMSTSFFRWLHVSRQFSCSHTFSLSANEQTNIFIFCWLFRCRVIGSFDKQHQLSLASSPDLYRWSNKRCKSTPELHSIAASTISPGFLLSPFVLKTKETLERPALRLWWSAQ